MTTFQKILDPWDDAAKISRDLTSLSEELIVFLGAELWCEKCRQAKPLFDLIYQKKPSKTIMLWLDVEEHAEFIGDYIPDTLPEVFFYKNGIFITKGTLDIEKSKSSGTLVIKDISNKIVTDELDIFNTLISKNWAS